MRRRTALILGAILALAAASPVAAARPSKTDFEPTTLPPEAFAGACEDRIQLEDRFASAREFDFGSRVMQTGGYRSTLTNLDTGASVELTYFGRLTLRETELGLSLTTGGSFLYWITAPDPRSSLGVGIWLITGNFSTTLDPATRSVVVPEVVRGRVVDICAALGA